jgi:phenylacetic acid degradation operon negative regulatory protein
VTTIRQSAHARAPQPRSLIVTVYGLHARNGEGWLSVATLIRLLAELHVDERAVRSAVSRLKRRGILEARRVDDAAGYALSESARAILAEGDRRIYRQRGAAAGEGWLLAVFSVPEAQRQRRHLLRSRLTWLGFGTVSAGVWVAPAHLEKETVAVLEREGLWAYVDLFRASRVGSGDSPGNVGTWWDLDALQEMYDDFLAAYRPVLAAWRRRRRTDDAAAFADHTRAVTAWRRLPFLDPGLPDDLLPAGWNGTAAANLFLALHDRLTGPAQRHVKEVGG